MEAMINGSSKVRRAIAGPFPKNGNKLSIRTAKQLSAVLPGKKVVGTLTYERGVQ
jgi:hypothetical protein